MISLLNFQLGASNPLCFKGKRPKHPFYGGSLVPQSINNHLQSTEQTYLVYGSIKKILQDKPSEKPIIDPPLDISKLIAGVESKAYYGR